MQFSRSDVAESVRQALAASGLAPARLELEITESILLEETESTLQALQRLKGLGVRIAMDDFGTGYSSLSYLRRFPFDKIKIDRSFVMDIETDPAANRLLESIVQLCKVLGMRTVAEGVETEGQANVLRSLGCDELQGYLYAKPMSAKALALWAMNDDGPRSIEFRASLFQETQPTSLH